MANRTDTGADRVRGTNPQFLVDKILRNKIYGCRYWKEFCTGLTAESLVDEAIKLEYVGGSYGGNRAPTKFICLTLKLLQIAPEKEIILEYIRNPDYKYVSALAMFYWRLIATAKEIYEVLEEYYSDYRKLRYRNEDGSFQISHMDEFAEKLLNNEVHCSTILPHIQTRINLEDASVLTPRVSIIEKELQDELDEGEEEGETLEGTNGKDRSKSRDRDRKKKKKKKRRHSYSDSRSRSRSDSRENRKKKKKHKKEKKLWRKVVSGKHQKDKRKSRSPSQEAQKGPPAQNSIEAENELRRSLGIPLLPTN